MFDWFKKRPRITRADLESLIEATPDAARKTHIFLVPRRLERELFLSVMRRPLAVGLYVLTFERYGFYPASEPRPDDVEHGYVTSDGIFVHFIQPASIDLTLAIQESWWPGVHYR